MKNLAEKAIKVKLTMRRANLVRRDAAAEAFVQQQMDDASLVVNSKLFRDKSNPINKIMTAASEVYTYHKQHTLPFIDKGPRLLPNEQYMDYVAAMRHRIGVVDTLMNQHLPNYDQYVQLDIRYRSQGGTGRAKADDYPTAEQFKERMGFDLRFEPLPEAKHFLFDMDEDDINSFNQAMEDTAKLARNDAVMRMLEPLQHLAKKLELPIGAQGSIFRDSAMENIVEGVAMARKLMIDPPPEFSELCDDLQVTVKNFNADWLRQSPVNREAAAKKLADVAEKMKGLMG